MLAFAADTLRGTTLAPGAYRGAHRGAHPGGAAKTIRWLAAGLLLLCALLGPLLALLAYEGYIVYQLIAGASLIFSATLVLVHLASFAAGRIPRWDIATISWYSRARWRREPACSSGRSPASPAGVTDCCSGSSATAATRLRPPALAWPWCCS
jgi:hypothetical protein